MGRYRQLLYTYTLTHIFIIVLINSNYVTLVESTFENDVQSFANHLKRYAKDSLGVDYLQDHFDKITSKEAILTNGRKRIDDIVNTLNSKTSIAETVLKQLRSDIEFEYKNNPSGENRNFKDCCGYNTNLRENILLQAWVNLNDFCEIFPKYNHKGCSNEANNQNSLRLISSNYVLRKLIDAFKGSNNLARTVYFARNDGYYVQYPAQNNHRDKTKFCDCAKHDARFSPGYITTSTPQEPQDVIIAVDFTSNMQDEKMYNVLLKTVGILLDQLDGKDRVLLHLFRNGRQHGPLPCMSTLSSVTPALIKSLKELLKNEARSGSLKYVDVFKDTMRKFDKQSNRRKILYIVSSGKNLEIKSTVVNEIRKQVQIHNCSVAAHFLLITTGSLTPARLDNHNAFKKELCGCGWCTDSNKAENKLIELDTYYISTRDHIRSAISSLYGNGEQQQSVRFTLPHLTFNNDGTYLAACIRCMDEQKAMLGVACINFLSSELFGLGFEHTDEMYVFMIDNTGKVFVHPKYSEPILINDKPFTMDIRNYETADEFQSIYTSMISGGSGEKNFLVNTSIDTGNGKAVFVEKNYTYIWKKNYKRYESHIWHDGLFNFVISETSKSVAFNVTKTGRKETYHRLDVYNSSDNTCLMIDTIAIADESLIKLPAEVFVRPQTYYKGETKANIEQLTNYMEFNTNNPPELLTSSDTAASIRKSVVATSTVTKDVWTRDTSVDGIYTIWRYVGIEDGVFRSFPAHNMHPYYDPRVRPWYIQARANGGSLILTSPYQDVGTGTILITMAKTLHKKSNSENIIAGVMGIDFNVPYLQSLIYKYIAECNTRIYGFKCLIMDESGYLIFHPDFLNANASKTHIIEKEPEVAVKLIDSGLMKKSYCIGYFKETSDTEEVATAHIKWFYNVKVVSSPQPFQSNCLEYIFSPIVGTNMVIVKYKNRCKPSVPCPCPKDIKSTCTISNMQDMKACECPCNVFKVCQQDLPPLKNSLICAAPDQRTKIDVLSSTSWLDEDVKKNLKPCFKHMCNKSKTSFECDRLGCEWCYRNANGEVLEDSKKYCGETGKCPFSIKTTPKPTTTTQLPPGKDTEISTGELIAAILVPIVVIILIIIIYILYKRMHQDPKKFETEIKKRPPAPLPTRPSTDTVEIGSTNPTFTPSVFDDRAKYEDIDRPSTPPAAINEDARSEVQLPLEHIDGDWM